MNNRHAFQDASPVHAPCVARGRVFALLLQQDRSDGLARHASCQENEGMTAADFAAFRERAVQSFARPG